MLCLSLLVCLSLLSLSNAACSSSYSASYDLSTTPITLTTTSPVFDGGNYYILPCGAVDSTNLCPYSSGAQVCFAITTWERVSDALGTSDNSVWTPVNGNWANGAVSTNTDVSYDYDQCNADPSTNSVVVTYTCTNGDDSLRVISEPDSGKNGACQFSFAVDSSIVCAAGGGGGTSTGGGGGSGSSGGGGGGGDGETKKGLSGGWIFVIILLVAFTVYMFGGMAFNRFRRGKSGTEMVPNRGFWADLPGLVKDGCVFFGQKCRSLCSGGATKSSSDFASM